MWQYYEVISELLYLRDEYTSYGVCDSNYDTFKHLPYAQY